MGVHKVLVDPGLRLAGELVLVEFAGRELHLPVRVVDRVALDVDVLEGVLQLQRLQLLEGVQQRRGSQSRMLLTVAEFFSMSAAVSVCAAGNGRDVSLSNPKAQRVEAMLSLMYGVSAANSLGDTRYCWTMAG